MRMAPPFSSPSPSSHNLSIPPRLPSDILLPFRDPLLSRCAAHSVPGVYLFQASQLNLLKRGSSHLCHCLVILHSHLPPPTSLYDILLRVFSKLSPNAPRWNLLSNALSCTAEACEGNAALFQPRLLIYSGGGRQNAASTRTLRAE